MCKQESGRGPRQLQMFVLSEQIVDMELEVLKRLNAYQSKCNRASSAPTESWFYYPLYDSVTCYTKETD